jgi:hypothetical protein
MWKEFFDWASGDKARREFQQRQQAAEEQHQRKMDVIHKCLSDGRQIRLICGTSSVGLHAGEELVCVLPNSSLYEPRSVASTRAAVGGRRSG